MTQSQNIKKILKMCKAIDKESADNPETPSAEQKAMGE